MLLSESSTVDNWIETFQPPPNNTDRRDEAAQRRLSQTTRALPIEPSCLTCINILFMLLVMIQTFAAAATERFFTTGKSRRLPREVLKRAAMRLIQLNGAARIEDLRLPPSNRLEALAHERAGQWSIRINDQWRVCFRFENGDAYDVEIVDYH